MEPTDHAVTLHERPHYDGKRYAIFLNGEEVGIVEQVTVTQDRKPQGARVATTRTQSRRWSEPGRSWNWSNTRWEIVERILNRKCGLDLYAAEHLARNARTVR